MRLSDTNAWPRKGFKDREEYVFCHNDLAQHNIIVDPGTLRIRAIVDWEYAEFFPENFKWAFYKKKGPLIALEDEQDDAAESLLFMESARIKRERSNRSLGWWEYEVHVG
jgi:hypothetical protein